MDSLHQVSQTLEKPQFADKCKLLDDTSDVRYAHIFAFVLYVDVYDDDV